jgi:putative lipoic acid-binding regulatory protein
MEGLPPLELLEGMHDFPGTYAFKFIGRSDSLCVARIVSVIRDELELEIDPPYKFRESSKGNHIALTIEPHLESAEQVLAIYRRMRDVEGILVMM